MSERKTFFKEVKEKCTQEALDKLDFIDEGKVDIDFDNLGDTDTEKTENDETFDFIEDEEGDVLFSM